MAEQSALNMDEWWFWVVFFWEGVPEDSFLTAHWNIERGKHKLSLMQLSLQFFRSPKSNSLSFL